MFNQKTIRQSTGVLITADLIVYYNQYFDGEILAKVQVAQISAPKDWIDFGISQPQVDILPIKQLCDKSGG